MLLQRDGEGDEGAVAHAAAAQEEAQDGEQPLPQPVVVGAPRPVAEEPVQGPQPVPPAELRAERLAGGAQGQVERLQRRLALGMVPGPGQPLEEARSAGGRVQVRQGRRGGGAAAGAEGRGLAALEPGERRVRPLEERAVLLQHVLHQLRGGLGAVVGRRRARRRRDGEREDLQQPGGRLEDDGAVPAGGVGAGREGERQEQRRGGPLHGHVRVEEEREQRDQVVRADRARGPRVEGEGRAQQAEACADEVGRLGAAGKEVRVERLPELHDAARDHGVQPEVVP